MNILEKTEGIGGERGIRTLETVYPFTGLANPSNNHNNSSKAAELCGCTPTQTALNARLVLVRHGTIHGTPHHTLYKGRSKRSHECLETKEKS